ncbi:MAG: YaaA family protein, partial [Blautia sp.]|nr:YaaA family protein [Blautia sp.]
MKIILSPAKTMKENDDISCQDLPVYVKEAKELLSYLLGHSLEEARALWGCSEKLARENYERLLSMDLEARLTPAMFSYDGIAYTHMAPAVFDKDCLSYVQDHLRILSGFYGVLRPFDGVRPYRLEMGSKLVRPLGEARDLYAFWGDKLYRKVRDEDGI